MIDMVEARIIAGQIAAHLLGKRIVFAEIAERKRGSMRDAHLLRVKPDDFRTRLVGSALTDAYARHRHICIETDGGTGLDIWDVYGKVLLIARRDQRGYRRRRPRLGARPVDRPGGWVPSVSKATAGKPCPVCGASISAIKMGRAGWYYLCPGCQAL